MRAVVIQVNVYHPPLSNATHGDTLHIKCAGENICLIVGGGRGFVTNKSPHPVSPGGEIIKILFTSPSPLLY